MGQKQKRDLAIHLFKINKIQRKVDEISVLRRICIKRYIQTNKQTNKIMPYTYTYIHIYLLDMRWKKGILKSKATNFLNYKLTIIRVLVYLLI